MWSRYRGTRKSETSVNYLIYINIWTNLIFNLIQNTFWFMFWPWICPLFLLPGVMWHQTMWCILWMRAWRRERMPSKSKLGPFCAACGTCQVTYPLSHSPSLSFSLTSSLLPLVCALWPDLGESEEKLNHPYEELTLCSLLTVSACWRFNNYVLCLFGRASCWFIILLLSTVRYFKWGGVERK